MVTWSYQPLALRRHEAPTAQTRTTSSIHPLQIQAREHVGGSALPTYKSFLSRPPCPRLFISSGASAGRLGHHRSLRRRRRRRRRLVIERRPRLPPHPASIFGSIISTADIASNSPNDFWCISSPDRIADAHDRNSGSKSSHLSSSFCFGIALHFAFVSSISSTRTHTHKHKK